MQRLWRPLPGQHPFPTIGRWAQGLDRLRVRYAGGTGPLPLDLVERAEALFDDLLASQAQAMLLHGDLHHENILAATREPWLAIDPKGLVGEPAYEVGALLRNPYPHLLSEPDPAAILASRLDLLAEELALDRQRMLAWAFAQAVLSAWWHVEDRTSGLDYALACARLLANLGA
jgi:streptomycin 6-kinase